MSAGKAYMDVARQVGMEGNYPITVSPDPDGIGCVRIHAATDEAREYWGRIDFVVDPVLARMLAKALVACADEAEGE